MADRLGCADDNDAIILHSYRRWGVDCVHHLRGDFAFAVWDPSKEHLFIARDPFGARPLYYALTRQRVAFASQALALLELGEIERASSEQRIAEFLRADIPPVDQTHLSGISRLPAGYRAIVNQKSVQAEQYWSWTLPEPARESGRDLADRLAYLFKQAVARRVPETGSVAATLSGGLDSSAVAVTMKSLPRFQSELVPTYSIVFDDRPDLSERSFIESVLTTGGFEPHFVSPDVEDPFEQFGERLSVHGGLFLAPNIGTGRELLHGVQPGTVMMSGHGGDEVISHGYERFHEMAQDGHWLRFFRECLGANNMDVAATLRVVLSYYARYNNRRPRVRRAIKEFITQSKRSTPSPVGSLLSDQLSATAVSSSDPKFDAGSRGRDRHLAVLADPSQQYALELLDRDAAAAGLETRFPFWDRDLVEFMLSVPTDQKLRGGFNRNLMRRAMKGYLPDKVRLRRDKHDFSHHLSLGLLSSDAASQARFEREGDKLARYLNLSAVEEARCRIRQGPIEESGPNAQLLWRATAVAEWLKFADREGIKIGQ